MAGRGKPSAYFPLTWPPCRIAVRPDTVQRRRLRHGSKHGHQLQQRERQRGHPAQEGCAPQLAPPFPRSPTPRHKMAPILRAVPVPPADAGLFLAGRGRGAGRMTLPSQGPPQRNGSTAPEATVRNRSLFHVQPHAGEASRVQRRYEISPDVIGRRRNRAVRVDGRPLTATPPHRSSSTACSHWTVDVSLESLITRRADTQPQLVEAAWLPEAWDGPERLLPNTRSKITDGHRPGHLCS